MSKESRRAERIERKLMQTQEADQGAFEHLAEAAGLITDAEEVFARLAQSNA